MEVAKIDRILDKWRRDPDFLIEILQDVQDEQRYLPEDAVRHVADALKVPLARAYHIATFYKAFSLKPRGKRIIQVCMGTACHVKGATRVLEAFSRELGVAPGGTTADLEFSLEAVRCLGCCSLAPAVTVGDELVGEVGAADADKLLRRSPKEPAKKGGGHAAR
ncbi:MAG: NAD(P)H-dependent oxidoreductase subunit E [Deltaproteobacteria bacterium]|nr:NAD(P)H-dependent oxidoreductase subunit E [Deltaproteobacteria bacterium]